MCIMWRLCGPRQCRGLVVLLGLLTVAHLYAHTPHHDVVTAQAVSCPGKPLNGHDDEHAHSHALLIPSPAYTPTSRNTGVVMQAFESAGAAQGASARLSARAPPTAYRGRAAELRTLEVCRC